MKRGDVFIHCVHLIGAIICLIGFALQSYNIVKEFRLEKTSISIEYEREPLLKPPAVSICSAQATKERVDISSLEQVTFENITYSLEELVPQYNFTGSGWRYIREVGSQNMYLVRFLFLPSGPESLSWQMFRLL